MIETLLAPNEVERKLARLLKEKSESEIESRNDLDGVAGQLHVARSGLDALLWQKEWPIEQALRIAVGLGVVDEEMINVLTRQQER